MSGSLTSVLLVGAISFLRDRATLRWLVGVSGALFLISGGLMLLFGRFTIFREILRDLQFPMLTSGFGLIIASVLSGPRFNILIGEPPEVQERRDAEEQLRDSKDPYAFLELDSKRLNEYYAINQAQARGSFRWAVFAMFCGLVTIIVGIWLFYLDQSRDNTFLASVSTASGIVLNLVSGLYLYLHNRTQRRSLYYYGQLVRVQQLGLAIRLAESQSNEGEKAAAKSKVIDQILEMVKISNDRDTAAVAADAA